MSIRVCIPGISGKMGMEIAKLVLSDNTNLILSSGVVRNDSEVPNLLNLSKNIISSSGLDNAISDCDVCVDFTRPKFTMEILDNCLKFNKKLIIGTTGFTKEENSKIHEASKKITILKAANMSIGVNICLKLVESISNVIGNNSDIDIIEHHHKNKVDMPSGTSLAFEDVIRNKLSVKKDINHHCLRVGNIVGDHMIKFTLDNESIEINHKSFDRKIFAEGAILALKWIEDKDAGLYTMSDALSL